MRIRGGLAGQRGWLSLAALVAVVVLLAPPVGTYARRYVSVEALQFVMFATAVPALLVLGAPWRRLRIARPDRGGRLRQLRNRSRAARFVMPHPGGSGVSHAVPALLAFVLAVIAWRLPVSVDALARVPGLAVVEMLILLAVGTALWLQLVESPPMLPRLSRPQRGLFAAFGMWSMWILAYILGFSHGAWFSAYHHAGGLGGMADQELASAIMWAVPAICFVPVVFFIIVTWLRETANPDEELGTIVGTENTQARSSRWPRPPRGWQTPRA